MKKLTFVIPHFGKSGPLNQFFYLINEIHQDYKINIICVLPEKENTTINKFRKFDIEINIATKLFFINWFNLLKGRSSKDIIFHSFGLVPDILCYLSVKKEFWLSVSRNYPYEDYLNKFGVFFGRIAATAHIFVQKRCNYLVTCSESLSKRYDELKIKNISIQNGVPEHSYISSHSSKSIRLIFVGNLIRRKRVDLACKLFNELNINKSILDIIGNGNELDKLKKSYTNNIKFHGFSDNVNEFYKKANFLINLSESEGLPNSVLEALSYGCPCILSDIPPHRELKKYVGKGIFIIKQDEIYSQQKLKNLIEFINAITENTRKEIKQDFFKIFGSHKLKENFNNVYNQMLI